jgi:hypothetical protein
VPLLLGFGDTFALALDFQDVAAVRETVQRSRGGRLPRLAAEIRFLSQQSKREDLVGPVRFCREPGPIGKAT